MFVRFKLKSDDWDYYRGKKKKRKKQPYRTHVFTCKLCGVEAKVPTSRRNWRIKTICDDCQIDCCGSTKKWEEHFNKYGMRYPNKPQDNK